MPHPHSQVLTLDVGRAGLLGVGRTDHRLAFDSDADGQGVAVFGVR